MYERILVPTDGSEVADIAADAAIALADRFDARLHAVYVLELGELPPGVEDEAAGELAHRGERATTAVAERGAEAGVEVTTAILRTRTTVHRSLLEYVADNDIDLVVMGTYGRTGVDRFILGSVTDRTLRESPVPVVTVHGETAFDPDFERIVVPTDGSEPAEAAADHAIDLATATGAALHVVHTVDLGVVRAEGGGQVLETLEEAGRRAVERVIERAQQRDVSTIESTLLSGAPSRAIVEYATERDADCIVMGTHGRTGLQRYLLGSVTSRVVRLSEVPVLTTHGEEA